MPLRLWGFVIAATETEFIDLSYTHPSYFTVLQLLSRFAVVPKFAHIILAGGYRLSTSQQYQNAD